MSQFAPRGAFVYALCSTARVDRQQLHITLCYLFSKNIIKYVQSAAAQVSKRGDWLTAAGSKVFFILSEKSHGVMWIRMWLLLQPRACGLHRTRCNKQDRKEERFSVFLYCLREWVSCLAGISRSSQWFSSAVDSRLSSQPALQPGSLDDSCLQGCSTVTNSSVFHSNCASPLCKNDISKTRRTCRGRRLCQQPFTTRKKSAQTLLPDVTELWGDKLHTFGHLLILHNRMRWQNLSGRERQHLWSICCCGFLLQ